MNRLWLSVILFLCVSSLSAQVKTDVLVIGGGASGTTAGIQSSRMGVETLIIEETEWLGGMLTSAGVSAIDGNHRLPSGLWGEFRKELYKYYGGPEAVETGWVSNTLFEPSIGNKILKKMVAKESNLSVLYQTKIDRVSFQDGKWLVRIVKNGKTSQVEAKQLIDATELGDVMASQGVKYDIGMDSKYTTHEEFAPEEANDIVQDLTYVVTLQDFGPKADKTIKKPKGFDPHEFHGSCDVSDPATHDSGNNDCQQMINYARLPNGKYMINWPKKGNDIYLNIIEMSPEDRSEALKEAKLHSLRFVYYIQTELGFKNLGIAKGEYPTNDNLPMIPYHRESRRIHGLVQMNLNHVLEPYNQTHPLYRTGIAVGDYTIDHHHLKNPAAPNIDFVKIRVPSYNVPMGSLIPKDVENLLVAEKSISVTNIVNGATRLQPVVLEIGQAAGAIAALSVLEGKTPSKLSVRKVQSALLDSKVFLMPFMDIQPEDQHFKSVQRIGSAGVLKGYGVPFKWANQTWFYPEREVSQFDIVDGLRPYFSELTNYWDASGENLTLSFLVDLFSVLQKDITLKQIEQDWTSFQFKENYNEQKKLNRLQAAVLIDYYLDPFSKQIDIYGNTINQINNN